MKNQLAVLIILALIVSSCSPKFYVPNTQNVPLLSEKGETNLTLSGNGNQVEFQGAFAASENIALQANGGLFIPPDLDNGNGGSGKYAELGVGYFKKLGDNLVFETYGILGVGSFENHLPSTVSSSPQTMGDISANIFRVGVQPNIGYKSKNFSAAFATRFANVSYNNIEGDLIFEGENQIAFLDKNSSVLMLEPSITLRAGFDKVKLQLQYIYSLNLSNSDFRQDPSLLSVGLNFNFR